MEKSEVNKILDEMVEKKQIESWKLEEYNGWRGIPSVKINGNELLLCNEFIHLNSLNISTIYDYANKQSVKQYMQYIIKHSDLLDKYYIRTVGELKDCVFREN